MSDYQPEGCKILVKVEKVKEQTEGGIWKPPTAKDDEQLAATTGEVVAIGPSVDIAFNDGPLKVGDKIKFAKYGGVLIDEEDFIRVINDEDILTRVTE